MDRRMLGAGLGLAAMAMALTVPVDSGVAWAGNPPASGSVSCKVTGSGTFSPRLTSAGSPGGVKFAFTAKSTDCSSSATLPSGAPVAITGVTVTASGFWNPASGPTGSSCASLTTDTLGALQLKYVWVASPAIANTKITINGGTPWVAGGSVFKFKLPNGATFGTTTGSFTPPTSQTWNVKTNLASPCSPSWGPYATFTITSGFFILN